MTQLADKLGVPVNKVDVSLTGHNWGKLSVHGKSVAFSVCILTPVALAAGAQIRSTYRGISSYDIHEAVSHTVSGHSGTSVMSFIL